MRFSEIHPNLNLHPQMQVCCCYNLHEAKRRRLIFSVQFAAPQAKADRHRSQHGGGSRGGAEDSEC